MSKTETPLRNQSTEYLNVDYMRSLVKQYSELGQWTSAFFWADAAAAVGGANGVASGDDIWLLASAMLARGELHRAAHAVVSRDLHKRHLLCLGVAMRAYLAVKDPATALALVEECDPLLLEPKLTDQTHNRALGGVLVSRARALSALERRAAAADSLASALRADAACYEALDLLLHHHALSPKHERELIESLPVNKQMGPVEGALLKAAYRDRLSRYSPLDNTTQPTDCPITTLAEEARSRTTEAALCRARRLTASCRWAEALKILDGLGPWCGADIRTVCLLELKNSSELFVFAHSLVNHYSNSWMAWFAVGCYYYLIGKSDLTRRYLTKAKSLEPSAGCVWLVYGHSFAAVGEHDQAMAAYFKACQLMPGCYLPPLYVGVECSLLNNFPMARRFLLRAAILHNDSEADVAPENIDLADVEATEAEEDENRSGWEGIARGVRSAHVAHEAGVAALAAGEPRAAAALLARAVALAAGKAPEVVLHPNDAFELEPRWAATLDALGHAWRRSGGSFASAAAAWHERALSLRPARASSLAALGLCRALSGAVSSAADALHRALAYRPDDPVALALLETVVDALEQPIDDEDIPQFPFPPVSLSLPAPPTLRTPHTPNADQTKLSDMSMSFD